MDKKAKKILFNTFWSSAGWKDDRQFQGEDFEYAKSKGLMFDPIQIHHDECVVRLKQLVARMNKEDLAAAFLASLSNRALHLRSALLSWVFAQELPVHRFSPYIDSRGSEHMSYLCGTCHTYHMSAYEDYQDEDLNVLNFERLKWGGIRHNHLLYCMFDLEQFEKHPKLIPTDEDIDILKQILKTVESIPPKDGPRKLEKALKDVFKSNKDERDIVIEILAGIGVLQPGSHDRPMLGGKNDWMLAEDWRGEDGYNREAVEFFFGL